MAVSIIEEKMEAARKHGHELVADTGEAIDSIYIAGSLTAGLGNSTSDADLFVLLRPGASVSDDVNQYRIDGHRVDVEWYPLESAEALVEQLIGFELRRDNLIALHGLREKLDFCSRLRASETVVDSEALTGLRQRLADSVAGIRQTAINHAAAAVSSHLEDFIGAASEGDLDTAAFAGQSLVAFAGKSVAAASGDLYFSIKWVYKQLGRVAVHGFPIEKFAYYQRGEWVVGGTAEAESLVRFVQTCIVVSQLLNSAGLSLSHWPSWQPQTAASGLYRHPAFNVLSINAGVLLHWELNRQLLLKEPVAFVWALCDGRSLDDVVASVQRLGESVPALKTMTRARIEAVIGALLDKGLVGTEPFSLLTTVCRTRGSA